MKPETQENLKRIKYGFRLFMNGVTSRSMREKGLDYNINWGVGLPELRQMASEYGKDCELAVELWKENIRECKILATMIMPPLEMKADMVDLWINGTSNQELSEMLSFNLFQYIDGIGESALKWLASEKDTIQICGYQVLSCLFMKGFVLTGRGINEYIDQAQAAVEGGSVAVRHAAVNSLSRFCSVSEECCGIVKSAFRAYGMEIV